MADERNIIHRFIADMTSYLKGVQAGQDELKDFGTTAEEEAKKAGDALGGLGGEAPKKAAQSVGQIRASIRSLGEEIEKLSDRSAIEDKQKEIAGLEQEMQDLLVTTEEVVEESSNFGAVFGGTLLGGVAQSALGFITDGLVGIKEAMIDGNAEMERYETQLGVLLGGADKAQAMMAKVVDFAASTPFQLPELASSTRNLVAFGVSADKVMPSLKAIGDISAATGSRIEEMAELYGKARTAGTLYAEDINQLMGRGVPILDEFASILGKTPVEIKKMASEGKIGFDLLEQAFTNMTSEGGKFEDMMIAQSATAEGLASTLGDNLGQVGRDIGKPIFDAYKAGLGKILAIIGSDEFKGAITGLADAMGFLFEFIGDNVDILALAAATFAAMAIAQNAATIATTAHSVATKIATAAQKVFNAVAKANPYGLMAVGLLALVAAIRTYVKWSRNAAKRAAAQTKEEIELFKAQKESVKAQQAKVTSNRALLSQYEELADKTKKTVEEEKKLADLHIQVNEEYPGLIQNTFDYSENLKKVKEQGEKAEEELKKLQDRMKEIDTQMQAALQQSARDRATIATREFSDVFSSFMSERLEEGAREAQRAAGQGFAAFASSVSGTIADLFGVEGVGASDAMKKVVRELTIGVRLAKDDLALKGAHATALDKIAGFTVNDVEMRTRLRDLFREIVEARKEELAVASGVQEEEEIEDTSGDDKTDKKLAEEFKRRMDALKREEELAILKAQLEGQSQEQIFQLQSFYANTRLALAEEFAEKDAEFKQDAIALEHDWQKMWYANELKEYKAYLTEREAMTKSADDIFQKMVTDDFEETAKELNDINLFAGMDLNVGMSMKNVEDAVVGMGDVFGDLATAAGENFELQKAFSIAQTTIKTYESATSAYAALAGIPVVGPALGAIAAGAAVAAGLANIAEISGEEAPSFQSGTSFVPFTGPANLHEGEIVIDPITSRDVRGGKAAIVGKGSNNRVKHAGKKGKAMSADLNINIGYGTLGKGMKRVQFKGSEMSA